MIGGADRPGGRRPRPGRWAVAASFAVHVAAGGVVWSTSLASPPLPPFKVYEVKIVSPPPGRRVRRRPWRNARGPDPERKPEQPKPEPQPQRQPQPRPQPPKAESTPKPDPSKAAAVKEEEPKTPVPRPTGPRPDPNAKKRRGSTSDRGRSVPATNIQPRSPLLPLDRAQRARGGSLLRDPQGRDDRGHPAGSRFRRCVLQLRGDGRDRAGGSARRVRAASGGFFRRPAPGPVLFPPRQVTGQAFT